MKGRESGTLRARGNRSAGKLLFASFLAVAALASGVAAAGGENVLPGPRAISSPAPTAPWTPERMRGARPYPLPRLEGSPAPIFPMEVKTSRGGVPGEVPGKPPAFPPARMPAPATTGERQTAPPAYSYPAPFTRYRNFATYSTYPYSTVGKLFFLQNGVDYVCSAAVIGADAIWTAGHCVHDGHGTEDGWSTDIVFVPAYLDGTEPFGQWQAASLPLTTPGWYNSNRADYRFDMGGVVLAKQWHENNATCPADCAASCGDGLCDAPGGESSITCPADCPPLCGDGRCAGYQGESNATCPADCAASCGDGLCDAPGGESSVTCPVDCASVCGDGSCADGRRIGQVTGLLGFAFNQPVEQHWFDVGYPAITPFPGTRQYICAASYAYSDGSWGPPEPFAIGCDQTVGCSGGPWIRKFGTENMLNGNNSFRYDGHPREMYSPYFGDEAKNLYDLLTAPAAP